MTKYKILIIIYLISVLSSSLSNSLGINVQNLYRVPFINFRWIDIVILLIIGSYGYSLIHPSNLIKRNRSAIILCFVYLIYEAFELARSWHDTDSSYQIAGILCTLNFFILIDLSTFVRAPKEIIEIVRKFSFWGSFVLLITNLYLIYSFIIGNIVITDLDTRVSINITGARETVSVSVLIPFAYAFALYFAKNEDKIWKKLVYISTILSIYASLIITFHRGNLISIALITLIYLFMFSQNFSQVFYKVLGITSIMIVCYALFGGALSSRGYDPVEKISQIFEFATDINNPDWDKGRSLAREYELSVWEKNMWTGVGYVDPHDRGLPDNIASAHNFLVTSLFHNGLIGTIIYLLILFLLFHNAIKLWPILGRYNSYENDMIKLLIIVSLFWLIPFWTQEVFWEKYSLSIQFMYLGFLTSIYKQKITVKDKLFSYSALKHINYRSSL